MAGGLSENLRAGEGKVLRFQKAAKDSLQGPKKPGIHRRLLSSDTGGRLGPHWVLGPSWPFLSPYCFPDIIQSLWHLENPLLL